MRYDLPIFIDPYANHGLGPYLLACGRFTSIPVFLIFDYILFKKLSFLFIEFFDRILFGVLLIDFRGLVLSRLINGSFRFHTALFNDGLAVTA